MSGVLFIVATPIGNLGDMTYRAVEQLKAVDLILAEDTRQTKKLLDYYLIDQPVKALHEHNELAASPQIIEKLRSGQNIALVSDAGTPLISDPGFSLVSACRQAALRVVPIPGPSSVIAALSVAGLPTDQFKFIGFLPSKKSSRLKRLGGLVHDEATLTFFESTHRILDCLLDISSVFGDRELVVAKELTKQFENILSGTAMEIHHCLTEKPVLQKGEFVLVLAPAEKIDTSDESILQVLKPLLDALPLKQAAAIASEITGEKKNRLYQLALNLRGSDC